MKWYYVWWPWQPRRAGLSSIAEFLVITMAITWTMNKWNKSPKYSRRHNIHLQRVVPWTHFLSCHVIDVTLCCVWWLTWCSHICSCAIVLFLFSLILFRFDHCQWRRQLWGIGVRAPPRLCSVIYYLPCIRERGMFWDRLCMQSVPWLWCHRRFYEGSNSGWKADRASAVDSPSNFLLIQAALKKMFLDGVTGLHVPRQFTSISASVGVPSSTKILATPLITATRVCILYEYMLL